MLNCVVTHRCRDKKPVDNILDTLIKNNTKSYFDLIGGIEDSISALTSDSISIVDLNKNKFKEIENINNINNNAVNLEEISTIGKVLPLSGVIPTETTGYSAKLSCRQRRAEPHSAEGVTHRAFLLHERPLSCYLLSVCSFPYPHRDCLLP